MTDDRTHAAQPVSIIICQIKPLGRGRQDWRKPVLVRADLAMRH
jgi:hypothetical protein